MRVGVRHRKVGLLIGVLADPLVARLIDALAHAIARLIDVLAHAIARLIDVLAHAVTSFLTTEEKKPRPSVDVPVRDSTACSGCGIRPTTLPASLQMPAMSFSEPFGLTST